MGLLATVEVMTSTLITGRRAVLGAGGALALVGLTACGSEETASSSTTTSSTVEAVAATTGSDVLSLATAFAATLDDDQQTALYQEYTFANAQNWSNFPNSLLSGMGGGGGPGGGSSNSSGRVGVQTSTFGDEQWTAFEALMVAATSTAENQGWDEIQQILNADDYLNSVDSGGGYGSGNYFVAFLGTPSDTGTWELQFGGHHLVFGNTYTDGSLAAATPSFRGLEPVAAFDWDGRTNAPMADELAAFTALLAGLDDSQRTEATVSTSDLVLGPGQDWVFPTTYEGTPVAGMTDAQRQLVLAAIATYVDDIAGTETILAQYETELEETYVCYQGTGEFTTRGDYVRIDGPSVWLELAMQPGVALSDPHIHSVWRDRTSDYGGLTG